MNIKKFVTEDKQNLLSLRRWFHEHPELSRQEFETAAKIEEILDGYGIEHRRVGETGVYGVIRGKLEGNKVVVLRADIDALPIAEESELSYCSKNRGVMHACGHDVHTTALLGAAKVLQSQRELFGGEVRLFFQQAEEIGYGAKVFLKENLLCGADRVFGVHVAPDIPVGKVGVKAGPNNASVDHFKISIHGAAAHVSTPQRGTDALYISAQLVIALQAIVTRQTAPTDTVIIGIGKLNAGTAYNIVAEDAVIEGTTRTFTPQQREFVNRRIDEVSQSVAQMYGATAQVIWTDYASPLVNHASVCKDVGKIVTDLYGEDSLVTDRELSLGGDDFAEFLLQVPGVYAYVGTSNSALPCTLVPAHNGKFDVDEDALPVATSLYAEYAYRVLTGHNA